jgi:hypothetical protein
MCFDPGREPERHSNMLSKAAEVGIRVANPSVASFRGKAFHVVMEKMNLSYWKRQPESVKSVDAGSGSLSFEI